MVTAVASQPRLEQDTALNSNLVSDVSGEIPSRLQIFLETIRRRSPLAAGGMGEVCRAYDTRLDREVAIKVLPESVTSDPDRLRRFEQEARAAAALNHTNILAVHQMARSLRRRHRHAYRRIDVSYNCLRPAGPNQWMLHIPLGKAVFSVESSGVVLQFTGIRIRAGF